MILPLSRRPSINGKPTKLFLKPSASLWTLSTCEYCRESFRVQPSRSQGENRQRFCSRACSAAHRFARERAAKMAQILDDARVFIKKPQK